MGPDPLASYQDYQVHMLIQQQINDCSMDLRSVGTLCDAYLRRSTSAPIPPPLLYADTFLGSLPQVSQLMICEANHHKIISSSKPSTTDQIDMSSTIGYGLRPNASLLNWVEG